MKRDEHDITEKLFPLTYEQTFLDKVVNNLGPTGIHCYITVLNRYLCKHHYTESGKKLSPMQLLNMWQKETKFFDRWYAMKLYQVQNDFRR